VADKTEKTVLFDITQGQYVRLIALSEVNDGPWTTIAELNVLAVQPDTDINNDGKVNIEDFAVLATWWDDENTCSLPDWCGGADFNMSGTIDFTDLTYFVENWLWQGDDNGASEKFSFIWISDTQTYTDQVHGGTWEMFHDMMPWIAAEKNELNIKFAGHIGDVQIMDLYSDVRIQNTRNEFNILGNASIPYAISLGNHDGCENVGSGPNRTEKYNRYFPLSDYINLSSFGGYFDTPVAGPMDNTYHYFNAGGIDWLVLAIEFGPHDETMPWMENVIASHPNHKIIILYHCWLISDSTIEAEQATVKYGRDNSAIDTWNRIKKYNNVFMILSGHIWGHVRRVETGEKGNKVYMLCHDFCGEGNGYLNIIEFDPENDKFMVKSYSPYLNQYKTDSMFEYEYDNLGIFLEGTEF